MSRATSDGVPTPIVSPRTTSSTPSSNSRVATGSTCVGDTGPSYGQPNATEMYARTRAPAGRAPSMTVRASSSTVSRCGYCFITSNRSLDLSRRTSVSLLAKTDALRGPPTSKDISPKNSPSPSSPSSTSCPSASLTTFPPPRLIRYIASPSSPSAMIRSPSMNSICSSLSTRVPNSS